MAHDALILAFDTATPCCSIALTRKGITDGVVVASLSLNSGVTHSRRLLSSIDWLLKESALTLADVSGVAVGLGPGSFTGLRIGMATAKGLTHGTGMPLIGISSLDSIGASVRSEKLICAVLDARKKEVYSCFYRCDKHGVARRCSEQMVLPPEQLVEKISEPVIMAGDGVDVYYAFWTEKLSTRVEFAPARNRYPSAAVLGFLASEQYHSGNFLDIACAAPEYVRGSDAELSLLQHKKK